MCHCGLILSSGGFQVNMTDVALSERISHKEHEEREEHKGGKIPYLFWQPQHYSLCRFLYICGSSLALGAGLVD
jgi:hypothetical protein